MRKQELLHLFITSCRENKPEKVQAYLTLAEDLKFDMNGLDNRGYSAANVAAMAGHTEVTRILAETGLVNWNKVDVYGWTPLHGALYQGKFEVAEIIMKQDNVKLSLQTTDGASLAMAAVCGGNVRCVRMLVQQENFDSWNIPDDNGDTPLMEAISDKKTDILKVLLNCPRVDLNRKDRDFNSPVMKAMKEEKTVLARLMIKCPRVELRTKDRNGASLQRIAREKGLSTICDLINDVMEARIGKLEEEKSQLSKSMLDKIPECPVCLERFKKDLQVFSCVAGHHLCETCKASETIKVCPTCKKRFSGRAHDFEKLVADLWG